MSVPALLSAVPDRIRPAASRALRGLRRARAGWTASAVASIVLLALPMVVVGLGLFSPSGRTWGHLASTVLPDYLLNTLLLGLGVGGATLVVGVATAWLVETCAFPGRRVFEWALILPLAVPAFVAAYTYSGMFDVAGPLQAAVRGLVPGLEGEFLHLDVMGLGPMVLVFALVLYPYVYLTARASFARQSRTLLEASRMLGCSHAGAFLRVGLPMARPAVAVGVALVLLEVLNDYGAVTYYGVPTFTTGIFRAWFGLGDLDAALRLSASLMAVVLLLLVLERLQRGSARFDAGGGTDRPVRRRRLRGARKWGAWAACGVPVALGFAIPVLQLGYWAVRTGGAVVDGGFLRTAAHSFTLAGGAAAVCVVLGLHLAYAVRLQRSRASVLLSRVAVLGYSVPGAVIAVGVLVLVSWADGAMSGLPGTAPGALSGVLLAGTVLALVYGYAVRFMAIAFSTVESGFDRVCVDQDEAARTLGASPLATLARVDVPLLKGTLAAAAVLVFVDVVKELPLTLILRPFGFDTLATTAFQMAMDEQVAESASAALLLIGTGVLPVAVLDRLVRRGEGGAP
jgi:iron(III) transport system permease protein